LIFSLPGGSQIAAPFLHEHELDVAKGGTRGYDPEAEMREMAMLESAAEEEEAKETEAKKQKTDAGDVTMGDAEGKAEEKK
jgi:hypothetical protein